VFISQQNLAADFHRSEDITVMANLAPGANREQVKAGLQDLLKSYPQFTLNWSAEWRAEQRQVFDQVFVALNMLMLLFIIPSLLGLVHTLAINVLERPRQLGVLRAIGAAPQQVPGLGLGEELLVRSAGGA